MAAKAEMPLKIVFSKSIIHLHEHCDDKSFGLPQAVKLELPFFTGELPAL
jgi:hypothetical protein